MQTTTHTDSRTGMDYSSAVAILPTLRETSPDDDCLGMVGRLTDRARLPAMLRALRAAGYAVSDSRDEAGATWVWVVRSEDDDDIAEGEDE